VTNVKFPGARDWKVVSEIGSSLLSIPEMAVYFGPALQWPTVVVSRTVSIEPGRKVNLTPSDERMTLFLPGCNRRTTA